jgi:hypothetical protein
MIRKLVSKLNKSITERVVSPRRDYEIPIKVSFEPDRNMGRLQTPLKSLSISGQTKDLSKSGIAFIVSSIRLREYYLVGENRTLSAELDLPGGKVKMEIIGQRYEQISDQHNSVSKFLIGAQIRQMEPTDREAYEEFLHFGKKILKSKTGSLELGVDKS